jgi:hypothetical protein
LSVFFKIYFGLEPPPTGQHCAHTPCLLLRARLAYWVAPSLCLDHTEDGDRNVCRNVARTPILDGDKLQELKSHLLSVIIRVELQEKVIDIEIINFWDVTSCNLVDR